MRQYLLLPKGLLYLFTLCLALFLPPRAFAVSALSLVPAGSGSFVLQGTGFADVAGVDLAITYDSSRLSNPRLTQGALARGAVTALNRSDAGTMMVSIIGAPAISGNGPIASVFFDQQGGGGGQISVRGSIIDKLGRKLPVLLHAASSSDTGEPAAPAVPAVPETPADSVAGGENAPVTGMVETAVKTGTARVLGGNVSLPADEAPAPAKGEGEGSPAGAGQEGDAAIIQQETPTGPTVPPEEKASSDPVSLDEISPAAPDLPAQAATVLERFSSFAGEKSAAGFISLFAPGDNICFRQEPAIAISTPGSVVALTIPRQGDKGPNFAFQGCQALTFHAGQEGWVLEVKPDPGAESALVVMLLGGMRQCPLVVAPAADVDLDGSGKVTEADFKAYLQPPKGEAAIKRRDLNGDGHLDFHDDYIFTANYLAAGIKTVGK